MPAINLYFRKPPPGYKILPGDRYILNILRKIAGLQRVSGLERVFVNLCKGFDELNVEYKVNRPFHKIKAGEPVVVLGVGKYALEGYNRPNPVVAGISLMTHPNEWPTLFSDYPVVKYLQHANWTNNIYARYFGADNCTIWPAGIDTNYWQPDQNIPKTTDILIYNKIMWDKQVTDQTLRKPVLEALSRLGLSYKEITYGNYHINEYKQLLQQSRAMIFLCEHESQGFACCEALAMNIPVFAWDQGYWLDPNRFKWNDPNVPATSIPFFDERCGMPFKDIVDFVNKLETFWHKVQNKGFAPRNYILENLTLKKSAERMLQIIHEACT